ncbi:MAG TPA: sulfur transferase domain-containing protein [Thermoanaerobaculia bacterium]|nr:sulfur transferase domain-containing protein [Thermoanaerobaculia bacterium]
MTISTTILSLLLAAAQTSASQEPPLADAHHPEEGVLFGGQPSEAELEALAEAGYTVLDLRMPQEDRGYDEATAAERLGLEYHNVPVGGATLSDSSTFERFFELFEKAERPVAVHCASGNRVGGLYYAYLVAKKGLSREQALEKARESGLSSESLRRTVDGYLDSLPPG